MGGSACESPLWLLEESYERVGDLAETISLLVRGDPQAVPMSLSEIVEQILYPLVSADSSESQDILLGVWNKLRPIDLLPFHKLLTGGFRIGVSRGNLCKALAVVADVEPAVISQRISGEWDPRVKTFDRIVGEERAEDAWCRPFLFAWPVHCRRKSKPWAPRLVGGVEVGWYPLSVVERGG